MYIAIKTIRVSRGLTYSNGNGTALSTLLGWQRVRLSEGGAPVTSSDWEDGELGNDNSSADSGGDFLGGLDSETNVAVRVSNDDDSLETGTLTGTSLLLDWLDLFGWKNMS